MALVAEEWIGPPSSSQRVPFIEDSPLGFLLNVDILCILERCVSGYVRYNIGVLLERTIYVTLTIFNDSPVMLDYSRMSYSVRDTIRRMFK